MLTFSRLATFLDEVIVRRTLAAVSFLCMSFATLSVPAAAAETPQVGCTKDGKALTIKGANADAKKKACEAQGGIWADAKDTSDTSKSDAASKQSSGGSGSW